MAELTESLVIKVRTDGTLEVQKLAGQLDNLGNRARVAGAAGAAGMNYFSGALATLRSTLTSTLAPLAIITAVVGGFKKAITSAAEADKSIRQLANSLELAGSSMERDGRKVQAAIAGLFNSTLYDDEALQDAFGNLLTLTGDVEKSLLALPVAANLAAKKNIDLQSATQLLGMAAEGATRGLKTLGVSFNEAEQKAFMLMSETERLNVVLGLVNERTSGAAQTNVTAWGGALKQAGKDLGEIWEKVGGWIFRALEAMERYFTWLRAAIRKGLFGLETINSGGHTSVGVDQAMTGAEARARLAAAVSQGLQEGAADAAPRVARTIAEALRQIPGLTYPGPGPGPQSLGDVFRDHPGAPDPMADLLAFQAAWDAGWDEFIAELDDANRELLDSQIESARRISDEAARSFTENIGNPLTDIFADLATTGGANFGRIAGQFFSQQMRGAAERFIDFIFPRQQVEGIVDPVKGPGYQVGGQQFFGPGAEGRAQQASGAGAYARVGQGIAGAYGLYNAVANPNPQSDTGTVISATLAGAALGSVIPGLGTVIGAVVGAIVGLIAGAISAASSSVGDSYQYASFGVSNGEASFRGNRNVTANEAREAQGRIQQTFDTFYNGYMQILLQFPERFRTGLAEVLASGQNFFPRVGLESGGDIGRAASAHFMEHFNDWVNGRLPRQIAEMFFEPLATAFSGVGLSGDRFREIWDDLQDIDPRQAMELLGVLATGLIAIDEAMARFRTPSGFGAGGFGAFGSESLRGRTAALDARTVPQVIADTDREIIDLAESLSILTGEDQIRTVGRIGELMAERYQTEEEYIRQIITMIDASRRQIDDAIRGYQLADISDPQGQIDFLTEYLAGLYEQLGRAASPAEAQGLYEQIFGTINQIAGIGTQFGGERASEFRAWAIGELQDLGVLFEEVMSAFGAALDDLNADFVAAVGPMIAEFTGAGEAAANAAEGLSNVAGASTSAADGLYEAAAAAREFASAAATLDLFGAETRASRAA